VSPAKAARAEAQVGTGAPGENGNGEQQQNG